MAGNRVPLSDITQSAQDFLGAVEAASEVPLSDGPIGEAARFVCRAWAGTPTYRFVLAALNIPTACTPYLNSIGRGAPTFEPQFEGGQCPVEYNYAIDFQASGVNPSTGNPFTLPPATSTGRAPGPLGSLVLEQRPSGAILQGSTGNPALTWGVSGGTGVTDITLLDVRVSRRDGLLDNCGNPDGEFQPGAGYQGEEFGDTFVTQYEGNDYSVTVGFPVGIDGEISIPVDIGFEGGDLNLDLGPGGGVAELPPEGDAEIGDVAPSNSEGEGEPPDVEGKECVGVAVTITGDVSGYGLVPGGASNEIYPRVVGNISLLLKPKSGGLSAFWSEDARVFTEHSSKFRPEKGLTVVRWRVKILDEVSFVVRPIYLEI